MLSVISPILITLAIAYIAFNKHWHRLKCAFALIIPAFSFSYFCADLDDFAFYGSAMAANAVAIGLLELIKRRNSPPSPLLVDLQIISLIAMGVNFFGYVMWFSYISPIWYDSLFLVLSVIEAIRLIKITDGDKVHGTDDRYDTRDFYAGKRGVGSRG